MSGFDAEVISDTHFNVSKPSDNELLKVFSLRTPNLILAGDIGDPDDPMLHKFLDMSRQKYKRVFYIPGNHEFYGQERGSRKNPASVLNWFQRLDDQWQNFHFFYRRNEVIDGVRVLGATGWSTEPNGSEWAKTIGEEGRKDIKFLEEGISRSKEPVLVVTHFPSTLRVLKENFKGRLSQYDYAQDLERLYTPPVHTWVFGHIHQKFDFFFPYSSSMYGNGRVRILSNPYGYSDEHENGSQKTLVFKVPSRLVEVKSLYGMTY